MTFKEVLQTLLSIEDVEKIELFNNTAEPVAVIPNAPGKRGSLAVYHQLAVKYGKLDAKSARAGLKLFAEHVEDARAHPGRHPNIDRLFQVIDQKLSLDINIVSN